MFTARVHVWWALLGFHVPLLSGTPRHGLLRVQQQTLLLRKGTEGSDVPVPNT